LYFEVEENLRNISWNSSSLWVKLNNITTSGRYCEKVDLLILSILSRRKSIPKILCLMHFSINSRNDEFLE
jgi:hypothetical protein